MGWRRFFRTGSGAVAEKRGLCGSGHVNDFARGCGDCAGCGRDVGQSASSCRASPATCTGHWGGDGDAFNLRSLLYCDSHFASAISRRRWWWMSGTFAWNGAGIWRRGPGWIWWRRIWWWRIWQRWVWRVWRWEYGRWRGGWQLVERQFVEREARDGSGKTD